MATVVVIALGDRRAGGVWGRAGAVRSRGADGGREGQGQAKSCLGTPEFMAPELYDELYDEKVPLSPLILSGCL